MYIWSVYRYWRHPFYLKQKHKNESFLIADRSAYHVSKMEIEFPSVPPQEIVVSYR